jgi:ferric-dicitrate binding protein FerR (iron transport regulator)
VNRPQREAAARQIMENTPAPVPPDLYTEAVRRGERLLRRRQLVRRVLWLLACAAAVAFSLWAARVHPWTAPPSQTTPPITGW